MAQGGLKVNTLEIVLAVANVAIALTSIAVAFVPGMLSLVG